jgi:hypothetical protein
MIVDAYDPGRAKARHTAGSPCLLVLWNCRMGFETAPRARPTDLLVYVE